MHARHLQARGHTGVLQTHCRPCSQHSASAHTHIHMPVPHSTQVPSPTPATLYLCMHTHTHPCTPPLLWSPAGCAHTPPRHLLTPLGTDTPSHAATMFTHTWAMHGSHTFPHVVYTPLCCCLLGHPCTLMSNTLALAGTHASSPARAHLCTHPFGLAHSCT